MVKWLPGIPAHEIILFRSLVSFVFSLVHIRLLGLHPLGNNRPWLIVRGISGIGALTLFFFTLKHMPLASATTIQYLSPVFTVILAIFLNAQRVRPVQWIFFAIALAGAVLIKGPDERVSTFWLIMGCFSAFLAGISYNAIIRCSKTDHPVVVVFYFPMLALPVMAVWCYFDWVQPVGWQWVLLIGIGVLTQVAQLFMTKALHAEPASRITPFKYLGSIYALLFGFIIFEETLALLSVIGIAMVIAGVIMNARLSARRTI